jgi:predicted phage terminase large subunit-like protein
MNIDRIGKYIDFFERTKNESVIILQGSKGSGKTADVLIQSGLNLIESQKKIRIQCFSESPKQQNKGLKYDFDSYFDPMLKKFKHNDVQKTYVYRGNEISFINIPDNIKAEKIANSLGTCDIRYINECNMYSKTTAEILRIKNTGQTIYDYNPWREFWINDLITDTNFLKTTWRDNSFLTKQQIELFLQWTEAGQRAEIGSYDYWRWQVMCEGIFAEITGEIFTPDNIHFVKEKTSGLHNFIIFADPSNAKGCDFFALTLTAIDENGQVILIDSFSRNKIEKVLLGEKIKEWQKDYPVQRTYIETNGEFGLKFYNDCFLSGIPVDGWYSRQDKYERIMANFDVITQKLIILDTLQNREFIQQLYTFKIDCANDDNIDCLNNALMAYILIFGELKILF